MMFSVIVTTIQLIEYDDPEDKADLDKANPNSTHKYNLSSDVPWTNSSLYSDLSKNEIVFKVNDNYTESETGETMTFLPGGSLDFKVLVTLDFYPETVSRMCFKCVTFTIKLN